MEDLKDALKRQIDCMSTEKIYLGVFIEIYNNYDKNKPKKEPVGIDEDYDCLLTDQDLSDLRKSRGKE